MNLISSTWNSKRLIYATQKRAQPQWTHGCRGRFAPKNQNFIAPSSHGGCITPGVNLTSQYIFHIKLQRRNSRKCPRMFNFLYPKENVKQETALFSYKSSLNVNPFLAWRLRIIILVSKMSHLPLSKGKCYAFFAAPPPLSTSSWRLDYFQL